MSTPTPPAKPRAPVPTGPIGGLLDPRFAYTPAKQTDIRETFRRVREQLAKKAPL